MLVGRSGSGKVRCSMSCPDFSLSGIAANQRFELRDLSPESWRKQLSCVGQNPQLPAATLRDNVLLARPDASEEQLQAALDSAWVSEFLPLLPQGVDTPVGDQAARLSRRTSAARRRGSRLTQPLSAIAAG
ncbi:hypothetical protein ACNKHK_05450 [Shigella flexneri]